MHGKEQIFLHAARDFDEVVLRNHTGKVQGDERYEIGGSRSDHVVKDIDTKVDRNVTTRIKGNESLQLEGSRLHAVTGNVDLTVVGARTERVKGRDRLDVQDSRRPCLRRRSHHARQGLHDHDCRQGRQEALVADARRGQRHAVQPRLHRGELGEGARPARGGQLHPHQERPHRDQVAVGHGHRRGRWNLRLAGRFEDGVLEQRADQGEGQAPREDPGRVAAYGSAGRPRGRANPPRLGRPARERRRGQAAAAHDGDARRRGRKAAAACALRGAHRRRGRAQWSHRQGRQGRAWTSWAAGRSASPTTARSRAAER